MPVRRALANQGSITGPPGSRLENSATPADRHRGRLKVLVAEQSQLPAHEQSTSRFAALLLEICADLGRPSGRSELREWAGYHSLTVAAATRHSVGTVHKERIAAGVDQHDGESPLESDGDGKRERIIRLGATGMGPTEIARVLNVTKQYASKVLRS